MIDQVKNNLIKQGNSALLNDRHELMNWITSNYPKLDGFEVNILAFKLTHK